MNVSEIKNDKIKASIIKIQSLQKQYEVVLQKYQEAGKNYIDALNSNNKSFVSLKGRTWWGSSALSGSTSNTKEECQSMCLNNSKCSGATFNQVKKYCWMRSGDSKISTGTSDDYALIPKTKETLAILMGLNDELLKINDNISKELTNVNPEVNSLHDEKTKKQIALTKSYQNLLEQKYEMERQMYEYNSIEKEEHNNMLYVNQQHTSLRFWFLIACLILLVSVKIMVGTENGAYSITLWLAIIAVLTTLSYSLSSPTGFAMWFVLLVAILVSNFA